MRKPTKQSGFTAIEILLTIGTIAISASMAVPAYRQYIIRNDLEIARQNVAQGLQRAKFLSQVAMNDSEWGFSTNEVPGRGVLFMGSSYSLRDTDFDELYSVPSTVSVTGVTEVTFQKLAGTPNQVGEIVLNAINGDIRVISVRVGEDGNISIPDDWITVCHDPFGAAVNMQVSDAQLEIHLAHDDSMGACQTATSSSSPSSSSTGVCPSFSITNDHSIDVDGSYTCSYQVVGTNLQYAGSYDMPITFRQKTSGWTDPWGSYSNAVDGNINPNCLGDAFGSAQSGGSQKGNSNKGSNKANSNTSGQNSDIAQCGDVFTYTCPGTYSAGTDLKHKVKSWIKKKSWYTGHKHSNWKKWHEVKDGSNNFARAFVDGDTIPADIPALNNPSTLQSFMNEYIDLNSAQVNLGNCEALLLYEVGTDDLDNDILADFQDVVIKVTIGQ